MVGPSLKADSAEQRAAAAAPVREANDVSDERLEQIEIKLAYQDDALGQLSDVVYRQQQQIEALRDHCLRLEERLTSVGSADSAPSAEDEKPPHY